MLEKIFDIGELVIPAGTAVKNDANAHMNQTWHLLRMASIVLSVFPLEK